MELVNCGFGELARRGFLSRCTMCEGFLLSFLALQEVHRCGVSHCDVKMNNLAFCINNSKCATSTRLDTPGSSVSSAVAMLILVSAVESLTLVRLCAQDIGGRRTMASAGQSMPPSPGTMVMSKASRMTSRC